MKEEGRDQEPKTEFHAVYIGAHGELNHRVSLCSRTECVASVVRNVPRQLKQRIGTASYVSAQPPSPPLRGRETKRSRRFRVGRARSTAGGSNPDGRSVPALRIRVSRILCQAQGTGQMWVTRNVDTSRVARVVFTMLIRAQRRDPLCTFCDTSPSRNPVGEICRRGT